MSMPDESPMRQFPGHYQQTPAPTRTGPALGSLARAGLGQQQNGFGGRQSGQGGQDQNAGQQQQQQGGQVAAGGSTGPAELSPVERGARTINEVLVKEAQFPELDTYVGRELLIVTGGF